MAASSVAPTHSFAVIANLARSLARHVGGAAGHVLNGLLDRAEHIGRGLFRLVGGLIAHIACRLSKSFGFVFWSLA